MIKWILTKIVGSKNQRELRRLKPVVQRINELEEELSKGDESVLVEKTREWQAYLHRFLPMQLPTKRMIESGSSELLSEVAEKLQERFDSLRSDIPQVPEKVEATAESIEAAKKLFHGLDEEFHRLRERYLNKILPEAFAVVKNGARRMSGETIDVCGRDQVWEMVHFDVQLVGGIALHKGFIAEMATGEGKTLVATMPVYLNALTGLGVHVVTVNDYLAQRDSFWMGALYRRLGLTVGCIQSQMPSHLRREQYKCDITYGTNSEFGFDYLRDNGMASSVDEQVQRGHYFSIIDEVDSILIDEARTPLIISGPAVITRDQQYDSLKPRIEAVVKAQTNLCNELVSEAKADFEAGRIEEAGRTLYKIKLGQPRNRGFMRLMQEPEYRRALEKAEMALYQDTRKRELFKLKEELYFVIEEKVHDADLMEKGRQLISPNDPSAFVLPDLGTAFAEMDENPDLTAADKEVRKRELQKRLDEAGERMHATAQLLKAYCLYEKDVEYVVRDNKVVIIDQHTGREMPGRRWSDGLHQAVEAKENVEIERENQTYATITIQNYFRLYQKLAGMTGTAETEAAEFHDIYKLDVLPIPTNRPCLRKDSNDLIYKTRREKYSAVVAKIKELHEKKQPILIGTASVEASEMLSRMLKIAKIPHEVLNAKNHQREAEIVSLAGQAGAVTVSTNMAGRGTDIRLGEGVVDLGGLFVLGTERHESRRIDRQLRGRCARQGDPGASQFFMSFEDDLMRNFGAAERMTKLMERFGMADGEAIEHGLMNRSVESAQKRVEQRYYISRKRILDFDDVMNRQREVVYGLRNEALVSEDPREMLFDALNEAIPAKVASFMSTGDGTPPDVEGLIDWANVAFPLGLPRDPESFAGQTPEEVAAELVEKVKSLYLKKSEGERPEHVDHLERQIMLTAIDKLWQEHLYNMDALRDGVFLRSHGQKDPLVEYKSEAFKLFVTLMENINLEIINGLFRSTTNLDAFEDFLRNLMEDMKLRDHDVAHALGAEGEIAEGDLENVQARRPSAGSVPERTLDAVAVGDGELSSRFERKGSPLLPMPDDVDAPVYLNEDATIDPMYQAMTGSAEEFARMPKQEKKVVLPKKKPIAWKKPTPPSE